MKPHRSAPASTAASTSSWRVRPQTLTSGRENSSRSFAPGSAARISECRRGRRSRRRAPPRPPAAVCGTALSATTTRSRGALRHQRELSVAVDPEGAEVAGVDADHGRAETGRRARARPRRGPPRACRGRRPADAHEVRGRCVAEVAEDEERPSAPASRSSRRCSSVEKKPLARSGRPTADRAARRSSSEPANAFVHENRDRARAAALVRGHDVFDLRSGLMSPADGERRLNSAIAPNPGRASASANLTLLLETCPVSDTGHV